MSKIIAVYIITDETTRKFYIGSTSDFKRRKQEHIYELRVGTHANFRLQELYNANKNLVLKFIHFELETIEQAKELEDLMLKECSDNPNLLNISTSSSGGMGIERHPNKTEIIGKITNSRRKHWENLSEEEKTRRLAIFKSTSTSPEAMGKRLESYRKYINNTPAELRKQSPETIAKRAAKLKGIPRTQEWRDNISKGNIGKKRTPEVLERFSIQRRKYYAENPKPPVSLETREKLRQANLGKSHSEETRQKLSIINKERQARMSPEEKQHTEETKLRISMKHRGKVLTPEHRAKLAAAKHRFLNSMSPEELKAYKDRLANSRKKNL